MVDLSLHILDVATNAFRAKATLVKIIIEEKEEFIQVSIEDDGCGMSDEVLQQVTNPFFTSRTTRKVGLGIPLFKQTCEQTGGYFNIVSQVGVGTCVTACMYTNSIDAIPLGDIGESIFVLVINPYDIDIWVKMTFKDPQKDEFLIDTREFKKILDGISLKEPSIMVWIKEYIQSGLS